MKKYTYEHIESLLEPIMDFMNEEFPNDCKLVITRNFAQVVYEHTDMTFMRKELRPVTDGTKRYPPTNCEPDGGVM